MRFISSTFQEREIETPEPTGVAQGTLLSALGKEIQKEREDMYTYSWFTLLYSRS